jgi:hypothetical protein
VGAGGREAPRGDDARTKFWKERGMRFLGCSSETGMLFEKASEIVQALS